MKKSIHIDTSPDVASARLFTQLRGPDVSSVAVDAGFFGTCSVKSCDGAASRPLNSVLRPRPSQAIRPLLPSSHPSIGSPSSRPKHVPTPKPTAPTLAPSPYPSPFPAHDPTLSPTMRPTATPTTVQAPAPLPSSAPTSALSARPLCRTDREGSEAAYSVRHRRRLLLDAQWRRQPLRSTRPKHQLTVSSVWAGSDPSQASCRSAPSAPRWHKN